MLDENTQLEARTFQVIANFGFQYRKHNETKKTLRLIAYKLKEAESIPLDFRQATNFLLNIEFPIDFVSNWNNKTYTTKMKMINNLI